MFLTSPAERTFYFPILLTGKKIQMSRVNIPVI